MNRSFLVFLEISVKSKVHSYHKSTFGYYMYITFICHYTYPYSSSSNTQRTASTINNRIYSKY